MVFLYILVLGLMMGLGCFSRSTRLGTGSADGSDGFRAFSGDEEEGASFIAEGFAKFSGQVFFVVFGEEFFSVDEEEEGGRALFDLDSVVELEAATGFAGCRLFMKGVVQGAVEDGRGDGLFELSGHVANGF